MHEADLKQLHPETIPHLPNFRGASTKQSEWICGAGFSLESHEPCLWWVSGLQTFVSSNERGSLSLDIEQPRQNWVILIFVKPGNIDKDPRKTCFFCSRKAKAPFWSSSRRWTTYWCRWFRQILTFIHQRYHHFCWWISQKNWWDVYTCYTHSND